MIVARKRVAFQVLPDSNRAEVLFDPRQRYAGSIRRRRPRRVRRFRGRSIASRMSVDAIIGMRVAKRLLRGLTRRWRAVFAIDWPLSAAVRFGPAPAPFFADRS